MLRLSVFGQIDLRDEASHEVRSVLAQPKRLALLVYLALARPYGFHLRDALLALFWPDQPDQRARNALRQAIHQLRQSLGPDVIVARGGHALSVGRSHLACDAVEFEDALDRGQLALAVRLYEGDLLAGFSIAGAGAFNEWLDDQRTRLRHRASRAAWALAEQQERAGSLEAAAATARRAAELTLDDERALRQLVSLLERIGDPAGALRAYEDYAARLRRDLDLEPSLETRELIDAVRARSHEHAGTPRAGAAMSLVTREPVSAAGRPTVTVHAFENHTGDAANDFVGRLVASAVAQGLAETRLVDVVVAEQSDNGDAPHSHDASRLHLFVDGSYHLEDDGWKVRAALRAAGNGHSVGNVASVTASRERPWEAAHELSRRVSGALAGHLEPRVAGWADAVAEPPSFEAHGAHLWGMELHLRGEYRDAISHFLRAATPGGSFAMPMLWAIQASCNLEEYEQAAAIHAELVPHRSRLSPAEQLGCDYFGQWLSGDRGAALRTLQRASELAPESEVLAQLGRDAMFMNRPRFAIEILERLDPEKGWMPSWTPYWRRLTEAYHMIGDHERERDAARRGRLQHPEAVSTLLYETRAHAALGEVEAVVRIADEAVALASDRFANAGEVLLVAARELRAHGHQRASQAMLARAIDWQGDACAQEPSYPGRLTLARMCYEAERWTEATAMLLQLRVERADDVDVQGCLGTLAARTGDHAAARESMATLRAKSGVHHYGRHLLYAARIASVLGDTDGALALLRGAFARGCPYDVELHADVDLALLAGDQRFRELLRPKG
jgi:DNA-binding SARP family transcriptional activator